MNATRPAQRKYLYHALFEHGQLFPTLFSSLNTLKPSHDISTSNAKNFNFLTGNTFLIRIARELCSGNIIVD